MAPKPMKKYLVTYHLTAAARKAGEKIRKTMTPEQGQAEMAAWYQWRDKHGDAIVELGAPTGDAVRLEGKEAGNPKSGIAGYSIVQAKSLAGAKKLFRKHPHLGWLEKGCSIEVREITPM